MTNITDDDGQGHTTTTVVQTHDRGSMDYNRRKGQADAPEAEPEEDA